MLVWAPFAAAETVFGPKQYFHTKGQADVYNDTFSATPGDATIVVTSGEADGSSRVSSAIISVNGNVIFGTEDFSQGIYILDSSVSLVESNLLTVEIRKAKRNGYLTVEIVRGSQAPTVQIVAQPNTIEVGQLSTLSWTSTSADSCVIEPDVGAVDINGFTAVSPTQTTIYTITATGPGGTATDQALVTVTGDEPEQDDPFVARYFHLVPEDATADYNSKRFSVITGLVQDIQGSPLENVSITLHRHVEFGTAYTDASGRFSIPVNGGGNMVLVYQKDGLITAHRKVPVSWNSIAIAETVQMLAEDPKSTTLIFDGNPETTLVHQSSEVSDHSGTRSCTTVFTGDNMAYELDADGNVMGELTTVTTRTTEFTIPESMPAKLPVNSGYTYCAELSVDGVERIRFDKPVVTWVDNFLGFDVGGVVPVGYYDRDKGVWVPSDNGVVVELLDTDSDGAVDAIDATGNGQPDDLNGNGAFLDEVRGLDDPETYQPGATFWRVEISHFTPWDCNWPYGPPPGAIPPNPNGEPHAGEQANHKDCRTSIGSFAEDRSRVLHEDIAIPGTDMTLHYASNRVDGYGAVISIPASGSTVPVDLQRIVVELNVAGRTFTRTLSPLPNQKTEFVWDGLDFLGEKVVGRTMASIRYGFVYPAYYMTPSDFRQAFAQATSGTMTAIEARQEIILWNKGTIAIDSPPSTIAEGWTLSPHHFSEPGKSLVYKGDGSILHNDMNMIQRAAGTGEDANDGDGGPALDAALEMYFEFTIGPSGDIYLTDSWNNSIRKIDSDGIITTIAGGNKNGGYRGDGGPASRAKLNGPEDIESDARGNLYFLDEGNYAVRKIDTQGIITTVAGNGTCAYSGDGGPAVDASLENSDGIAVDAAGNIYVIATIIEDRVFSYRIRKIDNGGTINTIAYIQSGYCPQFYYSTSDLVVDDRGNIYFFDWAGNVVRKIDQEGDMTVAAGNGGYHQEFVGEGGPATQAPIGEIYDIALDSFGNLYIAVGNFFLGGPGGMIKKVDQYGIITTVAGSGIKRISGDDGLAAEAGMDLPYSIDFDPLGNLFVGDRCVIRKVACGGSRVFPDDTGVGYVMTSTGQHEKTIDLDTGVTLREFGYNENNKLRSMTDQFGNQTTIQMDAGNVPTAIVSPYGLTTQLTIDANNHLTRVTYPGGGYFSFVYTPDGLMTAKIEPEGNRFDRGYDANGHLTDAMDEELGHWQFSKLASANGDILTEVLSGEGNITSYLDHAYGTGAYTSAITGPAGGQTLFEESANGLTVHKWLPCGMEHDFEYGLDAEHHFKYVKEMSESTPSGTEKLELTDRAYEDTDSDTIPDQIIDMVTINGQTTTLKNNLLQSEKSVVSPEGRTLTIQYDPATLRTTSLNVPGLDQTDYGYDVNGRLASVTVNARQTLFSYNEQGWIDSLTDPEGFSTSYDYDQVGRVTRIYHPDGTLVEFAYDLNGNMTTLTNPCAIDHGFAYNRVNRKSDYETPLSGSYSYVYDKDKRPVQINFPSGNVINNIYDNGRLVQVQTPDGNIDVSYLCGTKVGSITNGTDTITYEYDGTLITSQILSGTLNRSVDYSYDNDFNMNGITYAGDAHMFIYDNDGLLTGAGAFTITRNSANALPEAVTSTDLDMTRHFNGYGEIDETDVTVSSQGLSSRDLTRDNAGRIVTRTETVDGVTSEYLYGYDAMGRLLTVIENDVLVEEYEYGPNGNRTYEMNAPRGIGGRILTYSDEDHLLTAGSATYQYDLDGLLTTKTDGSDVTAYDYALQGVLQRVTLPDGRYIEYIYDPLGRRIAKRINGAMVKKYLWQGLSKLLAVYDGSDNLLMRFEYADGGLPVAMTKGGLKYYLIYDQVGSLRAVADASGAVVKKIKYDTFGNVLDDTNVSFELPFGFAGGLHDRDTGLVHFGFRDYDPDVGRWTAKDPIFFGGGSTDLYGYCLNDPVNLVDPDGLYLTYSQQFTVSVIGGVGSAIGTVLGGPFWGAVGGAFAGSLATWAMPCATRADAFNGFITGAVAGLTGGGVATLLEGTMMHSMRASTISGLVSGLTDAVLMGGDPIVK